MVWLWVWVWVWMRLWVCVCDGEHPVGVVDELSSLCVVRTHYTRSA